MAAQLEAALAGGMLLAGSTTMSAWAAASNKIKRKSAGYWEEERDMVVQLMMGRPLHHNVLDLTRPSSTSAAPHAPPPPSPQKLASSTTLDLLGSSTPSARPPPPLPFRSDDASSSSCCFDLDSHSPLPSGWEKCLDLQTGSIYYLNRSTGLSTSCDPRKATKSSVNWPTSPSSSSDLTYEANVPMASSSKNITTNLIEGLNYESNNLDLTLSLKPSSPSLRPNTLNHSLNHDPNHNVRSLESSQGLLLNNQSFASSVSSLPFNSSSHMKASFAKLPTCTSSTTSPASPSTLFLQELNSLKDMGSVGSSIMSSKKSKSMSMNQNCNGTSRPSGNNSSMSVRENPIIREPNSPSKKFSVSGRAKPTMSDTPSNANSQMITVGCANCLMFVMLPKSCDPRCPRCGASIDSDLPQPPPSSKKPKLFSLMN